VYTGTIGYRVLWAAQGLSTNPAMDCSNGRLVGGFPCTVGLNMRLFILLCVVVSNLVYWSFAKASEPNLPNIEDLAKLSDFDLAQAYLTAQRLVRIAGSNSVRQFSAEVKDEIRKRGSMQIAAVYDGSVSSACPRDSFGSGFAHIEQNGAELEIIHDLHVLTGVMVKDTIVVAIPPKQELLVGELYEGGIALVARSGDCSISFTRAVNLHDAVRAGDRAAVQSAIEAGADVNEADAWGTPLDIAVSKGSDEIVQLLIDAGADIEGATSLGAGGEHPLHLTAARVALANTARLLIARGAQLNARDARGRTPLITAVLANNIEVANVLLGAGADLEAADSKRDHSPLSWAACWGRITTAQFLLSKGAQINHGTGPDGDTPLHRAVVCCKGAEMIRYLVANGANVNATNKKGLTPMQLSFNTKDREVLRSLGRKLLQGRHGR
jgi:ankyrin repeat protein